MKFVLRYEELFLMGRVSVHEEHVSHMLGDPGDYLDDFATAGLQVDMVFGDYDREPFDEDESVFMIVEATQQKG